MNTKPDDETLALWVEDELDPDTAAAIDRWTADKPEWLERRDLARRSRELLGGALAAEEPVPHGEFFNARIRRETSMAAAPKSAPVPRPASGWRWLVPLTAAASLVFGFWLGRSDPPPAAKPAAVAAEFGTVLYTPEVGTEAEQVPAEGATVILLVGRALPDSWGLPETAAVGDPDRGTMASTRSQ